MRSSIANSSIRDLRQHDVVNPHLSPNERLRRIANNFQHQKTCVRAGLEAGFLDAPGSRAQRIVDQNVRGVGVSIDNGETRSAGGVNILRARLGAEFVRRVWFHRDELYQLRSGNALSIEGN